jgi:hypothetical protein
MGNQVAVKLLDTTLLPRRSQVNKEVIHKHCLLEGHRIGNITIQMLLRLSRHLQVLR